MFSLTKLRLPEGALLFAMAGAVLTVASPAVAQLDCRRIEVIVPFGAGGGTDLMARSLVPAIEKTSGKTVQAINMAAGDGAVAFREMNGRPADGCTLLAVTLDFVMYEANGNKAVNLLDTKLLYRAHVDLGFLQAASGKFASWKDVEALAKSGSSPLLVGGIGSGGFDEGAVKVLLDGKLPYRYVPYNNSGEMHADVMGGRISLMYEEASSTGALIEGGKVKPMVVAFDKRVAKYPDTPAANEIGLGVSPPIWRGFALHKSTPPVLVATWQKIMAEAVKAADYKAFVTKRGLDIVDGALEGDAFAAAVTKERVLFGASK